MRYLFLDDHHIERVEGLTRVMHQPKKYGEPILVPEKPWEGVRCGMWCGPVYEQDSGLWKMWYWADASGGSTEKRLEPMYAVSEDGLQWQRPSLGQAAYAGSKENNILYTHGTAGENILEVIADPGDPQFPYKGLTRRSCLLRSQDGISWERIEAQGPPSDDTYRFGYDALKGRYVITLKHHADRPDAKYMRGTFPVPEYGRAVAVSVSDDLQEWSESELIMAADDLDRQRGIARIEAIAAAQGSLMEGPLYVNDPEEYRTEIYSMPVFCYEDLYLGLPEIFNTSGLFPNLVKPESSASLKQNGVLYPELACSRDLLQWQRLGDREPFLPLSPIGSDTLDQGMIGPTAPIVLQERILFYYQGSNGGHASALAAYARQDGQGERDERHPECGLHLAELRRDGFVSFQANEDAGVLLTKPIRATGSQLFVNADAGAGELRVEIRDAYTGRAIPGYSLGQYYPRRFSEIELRQCAEAVAAAPDTTVPLAQDTLAGAVRWKERADISELNGRLVRLQFMLRKADLYSFWFSDSE